MLCVNVCVSGSEGDSVGSACDSARVSYLPFGSTLERGGQRDLMEVHALHEVV